MSLPSPPDALPKIPSADPVETLREFLTSLAGADRAQDMAASLTDGNGMPLAALAATAELIAFLYRVDGSDPNGVTAFE